MSDHLHVTTVNPVSKERTQLTLWHEPQSNRRFPDYAGRCTFNIRTGAAYLSMCPTVEECRALAANLLRMADAIDADTAGGAA